jgi:hypothetical protein
MSCEINHGLHKGARRFGCRQRRGRVVFAIPIAIWTGDTKFYKCIKFFSHKLWGPIEKLSGLQKSTGDQPEFTLPSNLKFYPVRTH